MKSLFLSLPLSLVLAATGQAQVRELWRNGLTNSWLLCSATVGPCDTPPTNYATTTAVVDGDGNTLVGGLINYSYHNYGALVAKFDPYGSGLWEYHLGTQVSHGVESLSVDGGGNIFFTARFSPAEPRPLVMAKLDPNGHELWTVAEFGASSPLNSTHNSKVAADAAGNSYFFGLIEVTLGQRLSKYFLAKFDPDGRQLWRTVLPGDGYLIPAGTGFSKSLWLLPDGSAVLAGGQLTSTGFRGVVAKIDGNGRLLWLTHGGRRGDQPQIFSSVKAGPLGTVLAAGVDGFSLFSRNGRLIRTGDSQYADEIVGCLPHLGFLLNQSYGVYVLAFGPSGRVRWSVNTGISYKFGVVPNRADGWVAAGSPGSFSDELKFTGIDKLGNVVWQESLPHYYNNGFADESLNSLLRAPDGSLRVVMNVGHPSVSPSSAGVAVSAFAVEVRQLEVEPGHLLVPYKN